MSLYDPSGTRDMTHRTDCGATYAHDPHLYRTPSGKAKACDGSTDKRPEAEPHHGGAK